MWINLSPNEIQAIITVINNSPCSEKDLNLVKTLGELLEEDPESKAIRQIAISNFHEEGELEIDDMGVVSKCPDEDGAYVMAWKWIDGEFLREKKDQATQNSQNQT